MNKKLHFIMPNNYNNTLLLFGYLDGKHSHDGKDLTTMDYLLRLKSIHMTKYCNVTKMIIYLSRRIMGVELVDRAPRYKCLLYINWCVKMYYQIAQIVAERWYQFQKLMIFCVNGTSRGKFTIKNHNFSSSVCN